jgi:hypothetical protein
MSKRLTVVAVLGLLLAGLPALTQMRGQGMMAQRGAAGVGENALDLTADQMTKIRDINLKFEKQIIPLRAKLQEMRLDLLGLIETKADQKKIDAAVDAMTPVMGDVMKASLAHWANLRAVLTPDQQARLDRMMGPGMGRGLGMGQGLGMGMGRGQGRRMMNGQGFGWMMGRGDDETDEGRGWGMGMWRSMCPRWW